MKMRSLFVCGMSGKAGSCLPLPDQDKTSREIENIVEKWGNIVYNDFNDKSQKEDCDEVSNSGDRK